MISFESFLSSQYFTFLLYTFFFALGESAFAIFSAECNFSFCGSSHSANSTEKIPLSKTDYFPNTTTPFGLEEMVERDCSIGAQAESSHFQTLIAFFATFLKKDQKLPYV